MLSVIAGIIIRKITGRNFIQRLALLCPTRGRPDRVREFIGSALTTAGHPERVEISLWVDDDDPSADEYEKAVDELRAEFNSGTISLRIGPSVGVPKAANNLYDDTTADTILVSNDDQVFIDAGWDDRLDLEIAKYPDGIFCMWFNDKWQSENFSTFPILSRRWIETLGYFQFPFFEHFFADAWLWMLAKAVGRDHYIADIVVEHRHWKTGKVDKDATYEKHLNAEGNSRYARDRIVIDKFERYFHADVEALKNAMS